MKILIYGINFYPELTGIGKYTGEMAFWLAKMGHEVRVITAPPYYPAWRISKGYSRYFYKNEKISGVSIWRTPIWIPNRPTGLNRILHLASFAITSFPVLVRQMFWRPDFVWMAAPAFMCAPGILLTKFISRPKTWIHIQDYEVDAAFNMGLLRNKLLQRFFLFIESFILSRFNIVSSISNKMVELAIKKGVASQKTFLFPNWVNIKSITFQERFSKDLKDLRKDFGIREDQLVALYSGNIGAKQGIEILYDVAKLAENDDISFIICGDGSGKKNLMMQCEGMNNIKFFPLQPMEKLNTLLGIADIHLLPQRDDVADLVMPSKLTGILASGRPVVITAPIGSSLENAIRGFGLAVPPGNPVTFYNAIMSLARDACWRTSMGLAARKFAEIYLDQEVIMRTFNQKLSDLVIPPPLNLT